jgi:type II secretory pathway pseudopilin PulG
VVLRHPGADDGFTIVESMVALSIIFTVMLGLLGTLVSASRGIVTSRQRSVATGLANQVLETARGTSYALVGLNSADSTLASDSAVVSGQYNPGGGLEPLAFASPSSSSPWPAHQFTQTVSGTSYVTKVYVTTVTPTSGTGDPYRRVTVSIDWTGSQRVQYSAAGVTASLKLSSFVFNAQLPADPLFQGLVTGSGGSLTISGTIDNLAITEATFTLPTANGDLSAQLVKSANGLAQSASTLLTGNLALSASGANASVSGLTAQSPSVKVTSSADNDAGTSAATDSSTSSSDAGGTISRSNTIDVIKGASSSLSSKSTAISTSSGAIGDGDLLPHTTSDATGPASISMPYVVSSLTGGSSLGSVITMGASHENVVIDRDDSGTQKAMTATASVDHPVATLFSFVPSVLSFLNLPLLTPYTGFVKIGSTGTVTATANVGQGVATPSITGGSFDVCIFDTLSNPLASGSCGAGYKRLAVTPGTAGSASAHASLMVLGASVSLDATVTSGVKSVTSTLNGSEYERAEATLVNWFKVAVDLSISTGTNLHVELDYGQITARAKYCLPTDAQCIQSAL